MRLMRLAYSSLIILSVLLCFSCSSKPKEFNLKEFSTIEGKELTGDVFSEDLMISGDVTDLGVVNDCLLLSWMYDRGFGAFQFIDEETEKQTTTAGVFGNGPGELFCQMYIGKSKDDTFIYSFNVTGQKVVEFQRGENGKDYLFRSEHSIKLKESGYISWMVRLENGKFVGMLLGGQQQLFVLLDENLNEINRFGELPISGMNGPENDFWVFRGKLCSEGNSFIYCTDNFGYITRYDIDGNNEAKQLWKHYLSQPSVEIDGGNIRINGHENLEGFAGVATDGRYIYATYSGVYALANREQDDDANLPRNLLVFDMDGHLLKKCKLKLGSTRLALSNDGERLYVYTYGEETFITRFDTKDILK